MKLLRRLIAKAFMVFATIMYMLGIVTKEDLYRFIGSINPKLRAKLEEEEPVDQDTEQLKDEMNKEWVEAWKRKAGVE